MPLDLTSRPQIYFYIPHGLAIEVIQPFLYGLEEEGIPFQIEERTIDHLFQVAYDAAIQSTLDVGISCDCNDAVLHHKNLKTDEPYMILTRFQTRPKEQLKRFGGNAARLVKGIPFKEIG